MSQSCRNGLIRFFAACPTQNQNNSRDTELLHPAQREETEISVCETGAHAAYMRQLADGRSPHHRHRKNATTNTAHRARKAVVTSSMTGMTRSLIIDVDARAYIYV